MTPTELREFGTAALSEIDGQLDVLRKTYGELSAKKEAWLVILGTESSIGAVENAPVEEALEKKGEEDITGVARDVIGSTEESGFKPKEITAKLTRMNFIVASGFVSNLLFRMKKRGEIVEYNGKYFLPKFDPRTQITSSRKDQGATEATP